MKNKKSKPIKVTVSFENRTPTQDEVLDALLSLFRLACDSSAEKIIKRMHFNSTEERIEEEIKQRKISEMFLSDIEKEFRKHKKYK